MLIMIYGDDTFRVKEKLTQMKTAFAEKFDLTGYNTISFPAEGTEKLVPADILQSVCSYPFLGKKRMVIVCGLIEQTKKAEQAVWVTGFGRMPETTIAVLCETESSKMIEKKSLFQELSKMSDVHTYPFSLLQGTALEKWISERVRIAGGTINQDALKTLVERVGSDLWQMSHEVEKLVGFAFGEAITKEMVSALVQASAESQIFLLMDSISQKRTQEAIRLLQTERLSGSDDHYVLTMLGRQVRILLNARSFLDERPNASKQEVSVALDLHPFVAQKAMQQAKAFSFERLRETHDQLFDFDQKIKTGKISATLAVDLTIDHLMNS